MSIRKEEKTLIRDNKVKKKLIYLRKKEGRERDKYIEKEIETLATTKETTTTVCLGLQVAEKSVNPTSFLYKRFYLKRGVNE